MMKNSRFAIDWTLILLGSLSFSGTTLADPFVGRVVEVTYGAYAGYGQDEFPDIVLGAPEGIGAMGGSNDVLSLGDGGSIILEFTDGLVMNGEGPDFTIFENPFYTGGDPTNVFAEVAIVAVSQDGDNFVHFPCDYDPLGSPINNPANWEGFSGVNPVYSNSENGIDPTDPAVSGGDQFDLEVLGLPWIRFVKIIDTNEGETAMQDSDGDTIYDPAVTIVLKSGFDLDAAAAINWCEYTPTPAAVTPTPSPSPSLTETTVPATPQPTPQPSPTPDIPAQYEVDLNLNQHVFIAGDPFDLRVRWANPFEFIEILAFIVLDVHNVYWFWPLWSSDLSGKTIQLAPRSWMEESVLDFRWPAGVGSDQGIRFWAVMVTPENPTKPLGNIETEVFDFE